MARYDGCEYCNGRVEIEISHGFKFCTECGSNLGPAGAAGLLF